MPASRNLRVYSFDPGRAGRKQSAVTVRLPWEPLCPGPVGGRIAVIDYNISRDCYYPAIDLDEDRFLADQGLQVDESNPQFHQQMVYAIAMETVRRFETALGRRVRWRRERSGFLKGFHAGKLRIFPHAFEEANAYYDPDLKALLFGYFKATETSGLSTLPGQIVFTCLSQDIVAHETTHAILDGIREHFIEPTSFDTPAYHEALADIVALFQHFSHADVLLDAIQRTRGQIYQKVLTAIATGSGEKTIQALYDDDNPLIELAKQFGEAMGSRKALRSALGTPADPAQLAVTTEAHDRGAILVAAIFDAFFSVYVRRTQDLLRMTYPHGRLPEPGFLNADLALRLAGEAAKTADRMLTICVRALDYCPPVDIQFGDYLRAIVTSDCDAAPNDDGGYRAALIDAFRARGIRPAGVRSYSEEALRWETQDAEKILATCPPSKRGDFRKLFMQQLEIDHAQTDEERQAKKKKFYKNLWGGAVTFQKALGLAPSPRPYIGSASLLQRMRPDGMFQRLLVAELLQQREEWVDPADHSLDKFTFRGGVTLVLTDDGSVKYSIGKRIDDEERLESQRNYLQRVMNGTAARAYLDKAATPSIRAIHRGY